MVTETSASLRKVVKPCSEELVGTAIPVMPAEAVVAQASAQGKAESTRESVFWVGLDMGVFGAVFVKPTVIQVEGPARAVATVIG
jgi:hypothetical protein